MVEQGDIYWADIDAPVGSEPGHTRPVVVIQNNLLNRSRIQTVIVCVLTTNLRLAAARGNVLLSAGEADLLKPSVVNVSQILTIDRQDLIEYIGTLSLKRVRQILSGINLILEPVEGNDKQGVSK